MQLETFKVLSKIVSKDDPHTLEHIKKLRYNGLSQVVCTMMEKHCDNLFLQQYGCIILTKTLDFCKDTWIRENAIRVIRSFQHSLQYFKEHEYFDLLVSEMQSVVEKMNQYDLDDEVQVLLQDVYRCSKC